MKLVQFSEAIPSHLPENYTKTQTCHSNSEVFQVVGPRDHRYTSGIYGPSRNIFGARHQQNNVELSFRGLASAT